MTLACGHNARIGRHDAVHIRPGPDLVRVQAVAQDGGGIVAAAAPQGGGDAAFGGADEARHHRGDTLFH